MFLKYSKQSPIEINLKYKKMELACVGITEAMLTTPIASMKVMLELPPLHPVIKREAVL